MAKQQIITSDTKLHTLAGETIARMRAEAKAGHEKVVRRRQQRFAESQKGRASGPALDPNERAAREIAARILNGATPSNFIPAADSLNVSEEQADANEQRAFEHVMRILDAKDLEARAVAAVSWDEVNRSKRDALARKKILLVLELEAVTDELDELMATCPDVHAIRWPAADWCERRFISSKVTEEMTPDVIAAGVISAGDAKKAKSK
jgi:hypothetical protein